MGLNCGATFAKYVLFAFNIIFFLGGAAVLGVGIWVVVSSESFSDILKKVIPVESQPYLAGNALSANVVYIQTIGYILIGIGSFVFLVGFMGCCGACKQWRPLLVGYAICLIIIMCVEVGIGIAVGVYKKDVTQLIENSFKEPLTRYDFVPTIERDGVLIANGTSITIPDSVRDTAAINALQAYFGCCGIKDYRFDFSNSPYWRNPKSSKAPPVFCCKFTNPAILKLETTECAYIRNDLNSNMNFGCVDKVEKFVTDNAPAVIGVAVGIGLIELVGIIFAFCLCCAIGDKDKY